MMGLSTRTFRIFLQPATWIAWTLCVAGCAAQNGNLKSLSTSARSSSTPIMFGPAQLTSEEMQSEVMSFADTYTTICAQALDDLRYRTARPEIADWALKNKVAIATASFANATGPNEVVDLLDMLVLVSLKRSAMEDHWIPVLLHEDGQDVLTAFRKGESLAWEMAARALTPSQIDEMHKLIDQWRADNPDQYYVIDIRFSEFAAARRLTRASAQGKSPSSLFSLLYIDPLANLDPVAQELHNYRDLTERMIFMVERMPTVMSWQAELVADRAIAAPQIKQFVSDTAKFADATSKYPQDLSAERQAAIIQIGDEISKQRQAFDQDLANQSDHLAKLLANASQLVDRIDKTGTSINTATTATVLTSEQASRRTLDHAFRLGLILILVLLIGIPMATLSYRWGSRRFGFVGSQRG